MIGVAIGDARDNIGARIARKPRLEVSILTEFFKAMNNERQAIESVCRCLTWKCNSCKDKKMKKMLMRRKSRGKAVSYIEKSSSGPYTAHAQFRPCMEMKHCWKLSSELLTRAKTYSLMNGGLLRSCSD